MLWTVIFIIACISALIYGINILFKVKKEPKWIPSEPIIVDKKSTEINGRVKLYRSFIILILVLVATLPFHYVLFKGHFMIFPKNEITFSNTYIDDNDIDFLIERYNKASLFEKQSINNEPLVRKLREKRILVEKSIFDNDK